MNIRAITVSVYSHIIYYMIDDNNESSKKKSRKIVPQNGHLLCKMVEGKTKQTTGFVCEVESIPVYEILELSEPPSLLGIGDGLLKLKIGDKIVCNSTGTLVQDREDEILYLFKLENVAAKVIE